MKLNNLITHKKAEIQNQLLRVFKLWEGSKYNRHFGERPADTAVVIFIYINVNEALDRCSPTNAEMIKLFSEK